MMCRFRLFLMIGLIALSATAGACGSGGNSATGTRLKVVSSIAPITSLVENVGGIKIDLQGLIPEGTDPRTYALSASDLTDIKGADLIILNGLHLEGQMIDAAQANGKGDAVVLLGDTTIKSEEYKFDSSFPESGGKPNPYIWLNASLAERYVTLIHQQLVKLDSNNAAYYDTNYDEFMKRIEVLDQQMLVSAQTVPKQARQLLTFSDAWAYWASRYGMTVVAAVQPANFAEPSAAEASALIDQIKTEKARAVFGTTPLPSPVMEKITSETGAKYITDLQEDHFPGEPSQPAHSYIGMMVQNMRLMIPALGGDAAPMNQAKPDLVFEGPSTARYAQ